MLDLRKKVSSACLAFYLLLLGNISPSQMAIASSATENAQIPQSGSADHKDWQHFNPFKFTQVQRLIPKPTLQSIKAELYLKGSPQFPHDPLRSSTVFGRGLKYLPTEIYAKAYELLSLSNMLFQAPGAGESKTIQVQGQTVTLYGTSWYTPVPRSGYSANPLQITPFDPGRVFYQENEVWPSVIYGEPGQEMLIANQKVRVPSAGQSVVLIFDKTGRLKNPELATTPSASNTADDKKGNAASDSGNKLSSTSAGSVNAVKARGSTGSESSSSAAEKAATEKAATEKAATEKAAAEKAAAEKAAAEKAAAEKAAAEKAAAEKAAAEKAAAEKAAAERAAAEKAAAERAAAERAAAEKAAAEKTAAEKAALENANAVQASEIETGLGSVSGSSASATDSSNESTADSKQSQDESKKEETEPQQTPSNSGTGGLASPTTSESAASEAKWMTIDKKTNMPVDGTNNTGRDTSYVVLRAGAGSQVRRTLNVPNDCPIIVTVTTIYDQVRKTYNLGLAAKRADTNADCTYLIDLVNSGWINTLTVRVYLKISSPPSAADFKMYQYLNYDGKTILFPVNQYNVPLPAAAPSTPSQPTSYTIPSGVEQTNGDYTTAVGSQKSSTDYLADMVSNFFKALFHLQ